MKARIVSNLLDVIEQKIGKVEGHRTDPTFLRLCDRISGQVVELTFIGDDAFEKEDNNYWLPNCCWTPVEPLQTEKGINE